MNKIRIFSQYRPVVFSVLVCVITFLCMRVSGMLFKLFPVTPVVSILKHVVGMAWPAALAVLFGYGYIFQGKGVRETLRPALPSFILRLLLLLSAVILAFIENVQWQTLPMILVGVVNMISIGVREEVIFRGMICNSLARKYATSPKSLWMTVIGSAAVFSAFHLQNLLFGVAPMAMVLQLITTFTMGMVFTAIYLRGGNIWVVALLHALVDASGLFGISFTITEATFADEIGSLNLYGALFLLVLHTAFTMYLLRKSKRADILARLEQERNAVQN